GGEAVHPAVARVQHQGGTPQQHAGRAGAEAPSPQGRGPPERPPSLRGDGRWPAGGPDPERVRAARHPRGGARPRLRSGRAARPGLGSRRVRRAPDRRRPRGEAARQVRGGQAAASGPGHGPGRRLSLSRARRGAFVLTSASRSRNPAVTRARQNRGWKETDSMTIQSLATTVRWRTALGILAVVLATLPAPAAGQMLMNGAGATFPYPIYSKWFDEYAKIDPSARFNYQSIGSGGGIRQITARTVDFGASDGPMTDEQLKAAPGELLHIPTVLGAVVATYNLPGNPKLHFTPDVLADVFLGKITKWNDGRITGANPGVSLPDQAIVVVHRSDGSGTTYI